MRVFIIGLLEKVPAAEAASVKTVAPTAATAATPIAFPARSRREIPPLSLESFEIESRSVMIGSFAA
jgi:hypothetical protein